MGIMEKLYQFFGKLSTKLLTEMKKFGKVPDPILHGKEVST